MLLPVLQVPADPSAWAGLLLGPLSGGIMLLMALRAYHTGQVMTRAQHTEAIEALKAAHAKELRAAQEQHESERALIVQQVADAKDYARRVEEDWSARLAKSEEREARWQDMALGQIKVAEAERRVRLGRAPRDGAG